MPTVGEYLGAPQASELMAEGPAGTFHPAREPWTCCTDSGDVTVFVHDRASSGRSWLTRREAAALLAEAQTGSVCWSAYRPFHPTDWPASVEALDATE